MIKCRECKQCSLLCRMCRFCKVIFLLSVFLKKTENVVTFIEVEQNIIKPLYLPLVLVCVYVRCEQGQHRGFCTQWRMKRREEKRRKKETQLRCCFHAFPSIVCCWTEKHHNKTTATAKSSEFMLLQRESAYLKGHCEYESVEGLIKSMVNVWRQNALSIFAQTKYDILKSISIKRKQSYGDNEVKDTANTISARIEVCLTPPPHPYKWIEIVGGEVVVNCKHNSQTWPIRNEQVRKGIRFYRVGNAKISRIISLHIINHNDLYLRILFLASLLLFVCLSISPTTARTASFFLACAFRMPHLGVWDFMLLRNIVCPRIWRIVWFYAIFMLIFVI